MSSTTIPNEFYSTAEFIDFSEYANNTFSNITVSPRNEDAAELNIPYTVMELLVAIVAIIGNLLVIIVFYRERRLRRRTNYYIISLASADFLVGLLGVPFAVLASVGLPHHLYACLFTVSLLVVLCTISIFCLVAVSIDRYWAILHPMAYSRNVRTKTAIGIISLCWIFGGIVGFLPLFGWHNGTETNQACLFVEIMNYNYLVFLYITTIILPAIILVVFYGLIYRVIIHQMKHIVTMNTTGNTKTSSIKVSSKDSTKSRTSNLTNNNGTMMRLLSSAAQKREVKATQNLSIIVLFFMICWLPLYTINCILAFCPTCEIHPSLTIFGIVLSHFNSAVNPIMYAYHLKDFRGALMRLFKCRQQEQFYRPSIISQLQQQQQQQRQASFNQTDRRGLQQKIYVDSPIWKRSQEQSKSNSEDSKVPSPKRFGHDLELSKITEASVSEYSTETHRGSLQEPPNASTQQANPIDYENSLLSIYDSRNHLCDNCSFTKATSPTQVLEDHVSSQDFAVHERLDDNFIKTIYQANINRSFINDLDNLELPTLSTSKASISKIKCPNCIKLKQQQIIKSLSLDLSIVSSNVSSNRSIPCNTFPESNSLYTISTILQVAADENEFTRM